MHLQDLQYVDRVRPAQGGLPHYTRLLHYARAVAVSDAEVWDGASTACPAEFGERVEALNLA